MGKFSRDKGARTERETTNKFKDWGLRAERVPLSGATSYAKGDIDLYPKDRDAPLVCEQKARKRFPAWLAEYLGDNDVLVLREDGSKDCLYVLPERIFKEMVTK